MAKVIFRKIRGRLVPIKIKRSDVSEPFLSKYAPKKKEFVARDKGSNTYLGKMNVSVPRSGKSASIDSVRVNKQFQRQGISKQLFDRVEKYLSKKGFKFIRSSELMSPAQVKIRATRKSRFIAEGFGPYQEGKKLVSADEAINIIKKLNSGKSRPGDPYLVKATTMIRKRRKSKK